MFGFVSRRRYEEARATADRLRDERDKARDERDIAVRNRRQALGQLLDADAANRRLHGRVLELGRRLAAAAEADPEHLAALEKQVRVSRKAARRVLAAYFAEVRRADRLQERLDDATSLNDPKVLAGPCWGTGSAAEKGGLL